MLSENKPAKMNYHQFLKFCDNIILQNDYDYEQRRFCQKLEIEIGKYLPENIAKEIIDNLQIKINIILIDSEFNFLIEKLGKAIFELYQKVVVKNGLSLELFLKETIRSYNIDITNQE